MLVMGLVESWWAVLAVPVALLIALGFGAVGMAITSFMKTFQQLDWINTAILPMFLFSTTFYPLSVYSAGDPGGGAVPAALSGHRTDARSVPGHRQSGGCSGTCCISW